VVRELLEKESLLERAETLREDFETEITKLMDLSRRWREVLAREAELPKDAFSNLDREKIEKLSELFSSHMMEFGFRSVAPGSIGISLDNYRPTLEDFEMSFDASASDNIRLIWAYTIALQELGAYYETNHLGITIFDEPGQQEIRASSREAFYRIIGKMAYDQNQIIVSTSENPERLRGMLKDLSSNFHDFGEKVIRPMT